jgi:hypothetical protein
VIQPKAEDLRTRGDDSTSLGVQRPEDKETHYPKARNDGYGEDEGKKEPFYTVGGNVN